MKYFIFLLVITLCLSLCSCMPRQTEGNGSSNPPEEIIAPEFGDNGLSSTDPENETAEITLPSQWGTIELPEIEIDNPTGGETVTTPASTEPPAETEGEESLAPTTPSEDEEDSGVITTPEDVFE